MAYHFTASRVSRENNAGFPYETIIDDCNELVIYRKHLTFLFSTDDEEIE